MRSVLFLLFVTVVAVYARPQSDCEKRRENALKNQNVMDLIPKCKENGDYEELQEFKDSKFKVCYNKKGHPVSHNSKSIKKCGCFLRKYEKTESRIDNAYIPQCDPDGEWTKKQCWDYNNSCWCVDENGKQVGDIVSNTPDFDC